MFLFVIFFFFYHRWRVRTATLGNTMMHRYMCCHRRISPEGGQHSRSAAFGDKNLSLLQCDGPENMQNRNCKWINERQKTSFRLSCGFGRRSANQPDASLKLTVPGVEHNPLQGCGGAEGEMFLQEHSHVSLGWDRRHCFSLVYTKSDGVLNTGSAASPRDKVGLAAILLRHHPLLPPPQGSRLFANLRSYFSSLQLRPRR